VLNTTTQPIFLKVALLGAIQDGAKYHTSKAMRAFFAEHVDRLIVCQLPSYSPDLNPKVALLGAIEYLWRKVKGLATHNKYHAQFAHLITSVDAALNHFSQTPALVQQLFKSYLAASDLQPQRA